jgi:hypothetical protein
MYRGGGWECFHQEPIKGERTADPSAALGMTTGRGAL